MWLPIAVTLLTPVVAPQPPLPDWQAEMLARRPKSRASVHRSGYPEDAALRAAGAGLAQAPISAPVVVGMTTTPTRIAHVEPAILSLLNQSQPCVVVLNVPDRYNERRNHWNGKRVSLPPWLAALDKAARRAGGPCAPCVLVHFTKNDYGPATKLVGTAEALRADAAVAVAVGAEDPDRVVVVAADDDHEWEPFALATLLSVGYAPGAATRKGAGYDAAAAVWTYYSYAYPRSNRDASLPENQICVAQAGDMLATAAPNLKALEAWGEELLPGGGLQSCFFVDDLFFAAYNEFHGATVYNHPWKLWLFREAKRRKLSKEPAFEPCRRGGCSPVTIRLRYPDGLAMGHTRETHSENCARELAALGWWPPPSGAAKFRDDLCRMGDF